MAERFPVGMWDTPTKAERCATIAGVGHRAGVRAGVAAARFYRPPRGGEADRLGKPQSYRPTSVDQPKRVSPELTAIRLVQRWDRLNVAQRTTKKKRLRECKMPIGHSRIGLSAHDGGAHLTGVESCGNVWACPVCSPKIRAGRMGDVLLAIDRHLANGGGFGFLSLTVQHERGEALRMLLDLLGGAWKSVAEQREYKAWKARLGLLGTITALEVTTGEVNGWHPHRHVLLFFQRPPTRNEIEALEAVLDELYGRWLTKAGRKRGGVDSTTGRRVAVRLEYVTPGSPEHSEQLGRYLTKLQAGFELTRGDLKQSRQAKESGGRMPMDLLDVVASGDADERRAAVARWREYEAAMTGKSAVRFSKGLRALLDMQKAKTDQELAEEEVDGDDVGLYLDDQVYRRIKHEGRVPALLAHYTAGGAVQVLRFIHAAYPGEYVAEEGHYPSGVLLLK